MIREGEGDDSTGIDKYRADNCICRLMTSELNPEITSFDSETEELSA